MKWLYKNFDKFLPKYNYNMEPILYLTNKVSILYVYSFDRKKEVVLTSDSNKRHFRYMSLFEIFYTNWNIIHENDIHKVLIVDFDNLELPF